MWLLLFNLLIVTERVLPVFGLSLNCGGMYDDMTAEVVRGENSSFTCTLDSAESTHTLEWTVNISSALTVGTCPPPSTGDSCNSKSLQPYFTPRRTESTRSVMTVDPTKANLFTQVESGTLICKDRDTSQQDSCPMDYITRASGTCSVWVDTTSIPWELRGGCSITQGNSSRGRYKCQWFIKVDEYFTAEDVTPMYSMTSNTLPTGSARCPVDLSLPSVDCNTTYSVKFLPGRQFFTAGTILISRPSTPTITCTPAGRVTENNTVTCTCTTDNLGQPAGRLQWLKGSSDAIASGDPGDNRLELRQTLNRSDDGVQFRCRLDWSTKPVTSTIYTTSVGYPPSTSELTISPSSISSSVTVSENTTVTFTCRATGGNPPSTMTLSDATSTLRSGPSPLTFDLPATRCEHSGVYTCTGSNGYGRDVIDTTSLFVLCSPRNASKIMALNFIDNRVETSFSVTAYPVPTLDLSYLGRSEITTCSPGKLPDSITMDGSCEAKRGIMHQSTCTITVHNVTSDEAAGIYQVTASNSQGKTTAMFEVKYRGDGETDGQIERGDDTSYFSVAVGLGVVLALLVIVNVVVVVWLWRRQWNLPWAGTYSRMMSDIGLGSIYPGPTGISDT